MLMFSRKTRAIITISLCLAAYGCVAEDELEPEDLEHADEEDEDEVGGERMSQLIDDASPIAATCANNGCNGLDPNLTACDANAKTLKSVNFPQGTLQLRYSNICQTKWAKVTRNDGNKQSGAWVQTSGGTGTAQTLDWVVWSFMWSNMWYSPNTSMKACAIITQCTGACDDPGVQYCTAYGTN